MTEPAHSRLGASSSYRWMRCPGSIRMTADITDEGSYYAKEGTAAHTLGERCLRNGYNADRFIDENIVIGNDVFTVDEDMAEAVQVYLDTVRACYEPGDLLDIERRFSLEYLHKDMFGTNDACIYRPSTGELFVFDYKHGKGVAVDVVGNSQLRYYALGAALCETDRPLSDIHICIVQPRAPHASGTVRWDSMDSMELLNWTDELLEAVKRTLEPDAPLKAGYWCDFCSAAGICPELRRFSQESAGMEFAEIPSELSPEQMAEILENASLIEDWVRAVRAHAFGLLEKGFDVPGYKLVAKRAQRRWIDEEETARFLLGCGMAEHDIFKQKLKSPAQLEKLLPKDSRSEIEQYYDKVSSGNTLARTSDKREAINLAMGSEFD